MDSRFSVSIRSLAVIEAPRRIRCAIYGRKSTEEGLEQEFNSLQAQRESAEAYILSQRQLGWTVIDEEYADGGFTGANLDRPALKKLLADVEAHKIDCVVVYKVDRLSRSLLDFAQLMSLFERHQVSFVSVTQEFNTTTSLGRLTLNILLSFAQFEREIIGERTRDKVSAARRKGKWTGGIPVLGYDVDPRGGRLVVNETEAGRVRRIFEVAARCGTLTATLGEVNQAGLKTKEWTSQRGRFHPGRLFSKSTLALLLGNILYTGSVRHKGTVYPGEHEAIIQRRLWDRINRKLQANGDHQRERRHEKQQALLTGLLRCACGQRMLPTFAVNHGQRYTYYVCESGKKKGQHACRRSRVARADLETSIVRQLEPVLGKQPNGEFVKQSLERVQYNPATRNVTVILRGGRRVEYILPAPVRPGVQTTAIEGRTTGHVPRISKLMALAIQYRQLVKSGRVANYAEVARAGQVSRPRLSQVLSLNNLAPSIQEALLSLPNTVVGADAVTERDLRSIVKAVDWDTQRKLFEKLLAVSGFRKSTESNGTLHRHAG
jgi:DNA invertase Pin-like site-specific DNA recombinase